MVLLYIRNDEGFAYLYKKGTTEFDEDLLCVLRFTTYKNCKTEAMFYLDEKYVGRIRYTELRIRN